MEVLKHLLGDSANFYLLTGLKTLTSIGYRTINEPILEKNENDDIEILLH